MRFDDYTFCTECDHYVADYVYSREVFSDSALSECEHRCHPE